MIEWKKERSRYQHKQTAHGWAGQEMEFIVIIIIAV